MRQRRRSRTLLTTAAATAGVLAWSGVGAAGASAAGVAYLDGMEVWASNLDGTAKVRLSAGEGDWRDVAQSDNGYVVGIRLEANKIANLSTFTVWNPDGSIKDFGPLAGKTNGGSNAYPLGLDLTASGGLLIYGYSNYQIFGNILTQGTFLLPAATRAAPALGPVSVNSYYWSSLVGERIVATSNERDVSVQDPSSIGSPDFIDWISTAGEPGDPELHRTDVAATGTVAALEYAYYGAGVTPNDERVLLIRAEGLGGTLIEAGQCFLNGSAATSPSLSQDAGTVAWSDAGGVKVGGVPTFTGPDGGTCTLTRPAVTISPTGKTPSVGPIDVPAILASRNPPPAPTPAPGPVATPKPSGPVTPAPPRAVAPAKVKASALGGKAGVVIDVTTAGGGTATATVSVSPKTIGKKGKKPVVVATGSAKLAADASKAQRLTIKATKSGKKLLARLKGKKVTLTITVGGQSTTLTVKLR